MLEFAPYTFAWKLIMQSHTCTYVCVCEREREREKEKEREREALACMHRNVSMYEGAKENVCIYTHTVMIMLADTMRWVCTSYIFH